MSNAAPNFEPLIYISYSRKDEQWLEKILVRLRPMEAAQQIRIFYDRTLNPGANWDTEYRANLEKAALGIVLLSPDWLAAGYANEVEFPALASRRLIPVLVRDCDWHSHPISKFQILMADGKALASVRGAKQEQAFRVLVQSVQKELYIQTKISFSREGEQLYALATQLAQSRKEPGLLDTRCLTYAFLERGREEPTPVKTPQFLWNAIPEGGRARYLKLRGEYFPLFPSVKSSGAMDGGNATFERAAELSGLSLAGGPIHARHLLAALLAGPDEATDLIELGLDVASFRSAFLGFIFKTFPDEPQDVWTDFLGSGPEHEKDSGAPTQPPGGTPSGPAAPLIAAYQSEDWTGRDLLNTTRDVNALSALVAGWNVQPPLSIGLFGEWGSGKSFFMRQMRKRVKDLALAAQASGKPQRECAYYKNIAQIEFNAWHYMEGDSLWACLVEHIFSNLGFPQDTTEAAVEARQKDILEKIGAKKALEAQATQTRTELEAKRAGAEKKANDARTELTAAQNALGEEKSALKKRFEEQLSSEVTSVLKSIPEAVQVGDSLETARTLSQEVRTLFGRISLLWNLLAHDPQRRTMMIWMLSGSAALFVVGQAIHLAAPGFQLLVRTEAQALLPIAGGLLTAAGKFRRVLARIGNVVSVLEKKNQEITEAFAKAEREQRQQIAKLEGDVKNFTDQIDQASREEQEHRESIRKLEKELAETDASRLLAEFIRSRADADDYRKHLGMLALVRRDFERLSDFFRTQRDNEQHGKERVDNNTVNRIILYIDDLDRCPPQAVVNMLQAIHLLLAFPIFVVVVAVDSRWVSRSLEACYDWLVPENQPAAPPRVAANGAERARSTSGATAHDYLEKIFQIPFWLAPMSSGACKDMIRGLTEAIADQQSALQQSIEAANQKPASAPPAAVATAAGAGSSQPATGTLQPPVSPAPISPVTAANPTVPGPTPTAPAHSAANPIDLHPRQLDVETAEIKKIDELAILIGRSPRVAKRFLNCYRLLKARMDQAELENFLKGSFQPVMEVLAIIVGAPTISRIVVDALATDGTAREGKAFAEYVTKHLPEDALTTTEGAEVKRLLSSADAKHLTSLRAAAPLVARFSFATHTEKVQDTPRGQQKRVASGSLPQAGENKERRRAGSA
jgi:TIR domain-containing protein/KAP-like P-loop domain-containing protein